MILLLHMLFGVAIASYMKNPILAVFLAFLSHYFLDFIPHTEYDIKNIKEKHWRKVFPEILKIFLDISSGILLIFIFSNPSARSGQAIIYIFAFTALIPDGLTFLNILFPNKFLNFHDNIHRKKMHFLKQIKISNFWRIFSQVAVVIFSIILLKF